MFQGFMVFDELCRGEDLQKELDDWVDHMEENLKDFRVTSQSIACIRGTMTLVVSYEYLSAKNKHNFQQRTSLRAKSKS
ncbi:MAG: hypothetical protein WC303_02960 [Candidatus Paceibacterota bacterium]|jgi:hypothetical protein